MVMDVSQRQSHWQNVYETKLENEVSWFQETPDVSLDLIRATSPAKGLEIVDIGGGASHLVDALLADGFTSVTVLDLSEKALDVSRSRMGERAAAAKWIVADITSWKPDRHYDIWHDRAALHFLIEPGDRAAYAERIHDAVRVGGHVIIGTFAPDGPERCSGLPVIRHDADSLSKMLGPSFRLIETRPHDHATPGGTIQHFQFSRFERRGK
jgi:2-polyprenyl-3-methyl-5-hydroxy-6-metoxy-1,4-benzoquinol methylase